VKFLSVVVLALVAWIVSAPALPASPARFWLSTSNTSPSGPQAPVLTGVMGATQQLHFWAQPGTVNPANPYDVNTNRFRTFDNFSLDLVTDDPILDFVDGTFTIHNPQLDGNSRYQFVSDSFTPITEVSGPLLSDELEADVLTGTPDAIKGLQAFSISTAGVAGLGHSPAHPTLGCHPADTFCAATSDGSPAWLVASVSFKTLASTGSAQLFLRIGANGMNYLGDTTQVPAVTFGANGFGPSPVYDSRVLAQRGVTLAGDEPDATINAIAALAGDFNGDAVVDAADYVAWRNGLGTIFMPSDYNIWRMHFGQTAGSGAALSAAVPEPPSIVMVIAVAIFCGIRYTKIPSDSARFRARQLVTNVKTAKSPGT
jgi:hypothetical protein